MVMWRKVLGKVGRVGAGRRYDLLILGVGNLGCPGQFINNKRASLVLGNVFLRSHGQGLAGSVSWFEVQINGIERQGELGRC